MFAIRGSKYRVDAVAGKHASTGDIWRNDVKDARVGFDAIGRDFPAIRRYVIGPSAVGVTLPRLPVPAAALRVSKKKKPARISIDRVIDR